MKEQNKTLSIDFYPDLFRFLEKEKLKIKNHFASTDLDCAYGIYNNNNDCILTFYYNTFENIEFDLSKTLDKETTISIKENDFIKKIKFGHNLTADETFEIRTQMTKNIII